ncbi:hypothetical protein [Blastococcus goldschmidtiae]|uniref:Uncharacterized protein n=1 Tax=Blastococcus goldschmidtiae TaxID=3075546 RepID=A0ABU2K3S7_9ACTN|nr:hypothetical protein [Blastococcus sp. DSM 46792]MDT0274824.1 hypothetical protein [Blastococcus sp. DSM 46792]
MNTDELREALRRDAELAGLPPTDLVHRVAGRRSRRRRLTGVVGCVLAIAVAVVGVSVLDGVREQDRGVDAAAGVDVETEVDVEAAAAAYRESLANGSGSSAASYAIGPESLTEFLPNTTYLVRNGTRTTLTDAVVVGHVTSVSPGRAFHYDDDEHSTTEVPFDDSRAMWRTAHAEVAVTEVLGGQVREDTIVVGFGAGRSFDVLAAGLPALGDLVFFLQSGSAVYDYEPGIWSVAFDGSVLAEVESDGRLTLPAVEPYWAEQWLTQTPTLDSLRAAAQQPARIVPFETLED